MGKKFNVDEYLKENEIEVTLNGKTFTVRDVPEDIAKMMRSEEVTQKEIVKRILNCEDKDLEGYGMAAFANIVKQITEAIFPPQMDLPQSQ
jgi:hypothetical protein